MISTWEYCTVVNPSSDFVIISEDPSTWEQGGNCIREVTTSSKLLMGEIRKSQKPSDRRGRYHSFHVVSEDLALPFLVDGTRISHEMETSSCLLITLTNCSAKELAAWEIPISPSLNLKLEQVPGMLMLAFDA